MTDSERLGSLIAYEIARQRHETAKRRAENGIGDLFAAVVTLAVNPRARGTTSLAATGCLWLAAAAIDETIARAIWLVVVPPEHL